MNSGSCARDGRKLVCYVMLPVAVAECNRRRCSVTHWPPSFASHTTTTIVDNNKSNNFYCRFFVLKTAINIFFIDFLEKNGRLRLHSIAASSSICERCRTYNATTRWCIVCHTRDMLVARILCATHTSPWEMDGQRASRASRALDTVWRAESNLRQPLRPSQQPKSVYIYSWYEYALSLTGQAHCKCGAPAGHHHKASISRQFIAHIMWTAYYALLCVCRRCSVMMMMVIPSWCLDRPPMPSITHTHTHALMVSALVHLNCCHIACTFEMMYDGPGARAHTSWLAVWRNTPPFPASSISLNSIDIATGYTYSAIITIACIYVLVTRSYCASGHAAGSFCHSTHNFIYIFSVLFFFFLYCEWRWKKTRLIFIVAKDSLTSDSCLWPKAQCSC